MSKIPTKISEKIFNKHVLPNLNLAKRGFVSKIPVFKIFNYILKKLYTGVTWKSLTLDNEDNKYVAYQAIYYHFRKWSNSKSFKNMFDNIVKENNGKYDLSVIHLDGTQTIAKKGGSKTAYGRKKYKTTNALFMTDKNGLPISLCKLNSGNHNDAFKLKITMKSAFKDLKNLGLSLKNSFFNADKAFDVKDLRKLCFNRNIIPNIKHNIRNKKEK